MKISEQENQRRLKALEKHAGKKPIEEIANSLGITKDALVHTATKNNIDYKLKPKYAKKAKGWKPFGIPKDPFGKPPHLRGEG